MELRYLREKWMQTGEENSTPFLRIYVLIHPVYIRKRRFSDQWDQR